MANSKSISVTSVNTSIDRVDANNSNSLLTNFGVKSRKESNAAYYLVSFLLKILGIEKSELTDAISKSIVDLDDLAQQIDSKIDIDSSSISKKLNYANFKNLELNIVECFSHLSGSPHLEKLIADTLKCVNSSFNYNTIERHNIYNLKNTEFNGCTTFYLFPLVEYLFSQSKFQVKNYSLFFLMANYIQILDDFIDVFDDRNLQIKTPITVRFEELEATSVFRKQVAFEVLSIEVQNALETYLKVIKAETVVINRNINYELFEEWNLFHSRFQALRLPCNSNTTEQQKYLKQLQNIIPAIICYVG